MMEEDSSNLMWTSLPWIYYFVTCGLVVLLAAPVFVYFNPWAVKRCIFANWIPRFSHDPSKPSLFGLDNSRNFYLHVEDGVDIGLWHILPYDKVLEGDVQETPQEKDFRNGNTVVLYLHGNSGNRGIKVRVELYKLLSKMNFHVVTLDYRGYGESTGSPTEEGLVADAMVAYKWLKTTAPRSKIIIWGHSLGSGVASKLAKLVCLEGMAPDGVILEAPFNNMRDAVLRLPFLKPLSLLPWYEKVVVDACDNQGVYFQSDESIKRVTCEILILHGTRDFIIPYALGKKLYHEALKSRGCHTKGVEMVTFKGYRHVNICRAPVCPQTIRNFVSKL